MYAGVIFLNVFSVLYTGSKSEFYFWNQIQITESKVGFSLPNRFSSTMAYASYWAWCIHYRLDCL